MIMNSGARTGTVAVIASILVSAAAGAQSLENRVNAARGSVSFTYETRASVCGDGSSIEVSEDSTEGWMDRSGRRGVHYGTRYSGRTTRCERGPAQVLLRRDGNRIVELRVTVGGDPERGDTQLGEVLASEATKYLLALAPALEGKGGDHAVLGAVIAEGSAEWRQLLRIARDNEASESSRKAAVFWVSQEAGAAATRGIEELAADDDASIGVRKDALFYIAQRPNGEGIPALVKVVEGSKNARLRKDAIFYLAQSRDERALALFERLLAGR